MSSSSSYHPARSLRHVLLSASVYHACLVHALSTEREEVMGLLMGQTTVKGDAHIWHSTIIPRLDKRPDRVEISAERLVAAPEDAVRISKQTGLHTRVLGWYHSHPHITPYPSHVDLSTQATYQMMDPVWVGLIFSVFADNNPSSNHKNSGGVGGTSPQPNYLSNGNNNGNSSSSNNKNKCTGRVSLHCFQSNVLGAGNISHRRVPVTVVPDEFFFTKESNKPSSVEAYVSPSLTILSEAREMKNTIAREIEEEIELEKRQNNNNGAAASSSSATVEQFDQKLYDEACKNVIETQTFTVCQKLLRPLLETTMTNSNDKTTSNTTVFKTRQEYQQEEMKRNEEILKKLREEVKQLKEASALQVLE